MPSTLRRWLPVVVWVMAIYTTIPFVRGIREWFIEHWDPVLIGWLVTATLTTAAVIVVSFVLRRPTRLRRGGIPWIIVITFVLVAWTFHLRRSPEEAVHLLEYGMLAVLLHRALRPSIPDASIFIAGAVIGALAGTLDEVIQWLSSSRYWDWRDLGLNAGAGVLIQLVLWRISPKSTSRISVRSLRIILRFAVALLVLLTLCLANTPRRVARYAGLLPHSEHLTSSLNPMAEYGHLHIIPGLGSFKSRLELEQIAAEDRTRAAEVAMVLDETRDTYGHFLDTWPVAEDSFSYEARVHLFARDRNVGKAREREFTGSAAQENLAIAWGENQLLEGFFGRTLIQSSFVWKDRIRQRVETSANPANDFHSAVGSHLITIASEGAIRILLLALAMLLVVADLSLSRYHRGPS